MLKVRTPLAAAAAVTVLAGCLSSAHQKGALEPGPATLDSALAANLAIAAVTDTTDTIVYYKVTRLIEDKDGYLVTVVPVIRREYVLARPDGSRPAVFDGSITLRVQRNRHVEVVEIERRVHG